MGLPMGHGRGRSAAVWATGKGQQSSQSLTYDASSLCLFLAVELEWVPLSSRSGPAGFTRPHTSREPSGENRTEHTPRGSRRSTSCTRQTQKTANMGPCHMPHALLHACNSDSRA